MKSKICLVLVILICLGCVSCSDDSSNNIELAEQSENGARFTYTIDEFIEKTNAISIKELKKELPAADEWNERATDEYTEYKYELYSSINIYVRVENESQKVYSIRAATPIKADILLDKNIDALKTELSRFWFCASLCTAITCDVSFYDAIAITENCRKTMQSSSDAVTFYKLGEYKMMLSSPNKETGQNVFLIEPIADSMIEDDTFNGKTIVYVNKK